jgi:hypothetical protein
MEDSGLSPEIRHNIAKSAIDGGVWLKDVPVGTALLIQTQNTAYELRRESDNAWLIRGHARFCPTWTRVVVHGSTWGGSMLKVKFLGRGMHMEFSVDHWPTLTTTEIREITEA